MLIGACASSTPIRPAVRTAHLSVVATMYFYKEDSGMVEVWRRQVLRSAHPATRGGSSAHFGLGPLEGCRVSRAELDQFWLVERGGVQGDRSGDGAEASRSVRAVRAGGAKRLAGICDRAGACSIVGEGGRRVSPSARGSRPRTAAHLLLSPRLQVEGRPEVNSPRATRPALDSGCSTRSALVASGGY